CTGDSYRENVANVLARTAMVDSVPGPDVINLEPPAEGIPSPDAAKRYASVLAQLATPYSVSTSRRASQSQYTATTLTPGDGLIATAYDFARFELALRDDGRIVRRQSLLDAWQ